MTLDLLKISDWHKVVSFSNQLTPLNKTWSRIFPESDRRNRSQMTSNNRSIVSLSLRELFLVTTIVAMILGFLFFRRSNALSRINNSKALVAESGDIEYRYWRQIGPNGSGSGQRGSGNEWQPATGIEIFPDFILIHRDSGVRQMMEREGLQYFDWRPREATGNTRTAPPSGH